MKEIITKDEMFLLFNNILLASSIKKYMRSSEENMHVALGLNFLSHILRAGHRRDSKADVPSLSRPSQRLLVS